MESRDDANTLTLKYIHAQQGGFPQYHVGDQVQFFTRDTLESTDEEAMYTVAEIVQDTDESSDQKTMIVRFEETLPENLSDTVSGEPKYVAENVTYAPAVTIRNCTFRNVPTRGVLCTTRNQVLIENNVFYNMSMATIYLSNDSDNWYESGPIRDMTIRNNVFYIKDIGRTAWNTAPAIYVHPVTKGGGLPDADNPIHKNITIEGNTYDDGLKLCAVVDTATTNHGITVNDEEIQVVTSASVVSEPVKNIQYASTDPSVVKVDKNGNVTGVSEGTATVFAYYQWNGTIIRSNYLELSVEGEFEGSEDEEVQNPDVIYELNPAFQIVRENENHSYDADSIEITAEAGDLYQSDNTLKNLFLYTPDVDRSNRRASVKVDGLPIRESGKWDTASFILMASEDDYYTIGKKSHFDGFSTVKEKAQSATEVGGSAEDNAVTSVWLGIVKVEDEIKLEYSLDGSTWETAQTYTDAAFGNDYQLGLGSWTSTNSGRKATFSEFKVGTADQSYAALNPVEILTVAQETESEADVFVAFGTEVVFEETDAEEVTVSIPMEVQKVEMTYAFKNDLAGDVAISKNGTALSGTFENSGNVLLEVDDGDIVVITCGGKNYTFTIRCVAANVTTVEKIEVAAMSFEATPNDEKAFFLGKTSRKNGTIEVTADEKAGNVEVLYGNLREALTVEKEGTVYAADYTLTDGLNSFYIQSVAADGITTQQYMINIVYDAPAEPTLKLSNEKAENLKAGALVADIFVAGVEEGTDYTYELCGGNGDDHNDFFKITGSQLKVKKALTDGQVYRIRVKAINGELSVETAFTIKAEGLTVDYPVENTTAISDNEYPAEPDDNILDGNPSTKWHTDWTNGTKYTDQESKRWIGVKLDQATEVAGIRYLPTEGEINSNDGTGNGRVKEYRAEYSTEASGDNWITCATGTLDPTDDNWQVIKFDEPVTALRVRLVGVTTIMPGGADNAHMTCAEFRVTVKVEEEQKEEVCEVFVDIEHGAWYEGSVQYVYDEGIIVGDGNIFAPYGETTRAMIAVILYRLAGSPEIVAADYAEYNKFTDLPVQEANIWYSDAVAWALKENVSTGDDVNMLYNPTASVTREQLALFLWRYAKYVGEDVAVAATEEELFGETYVNDWAKEGFGWAIDRGIIKGSESIGENGQIQYDLLPQGGATRAQLARVLQRFLGESNEL